MKKTRLTLALAAALLGLAACSAGGPVPGVPGLASPMGTSAAPPSASGGSPSGETTTGPQPSPTLAPPTGGTQAPPTTPAPGTAGPTEAEGGGPIPASGNAWGGVTLTGPGTLLQTGGGEVSAAQVAEARSKTTYGSGPVAPQGVKRDAAPAQIIIYADVLCPHCAQFEEQYAPVIDEFLAAGSATVEYRLVSIIPSSTKYPARGANALYCIAEAKPAAFLPILREMFKEQHERSDTALAILAARNGADRAATCILNGKFRPYGAVAQGALADSGITGTPAVFINGAEWEQESDFATWARVQVKRAQR